MRHIIELGDPVLARPAPFVKGCSTATTTSVVLYDPQDTSPEVRILAGFLAGYSGRTREAYTLDLRMSLQRWDARTRRCEPLGALKVPPNFWLYEARCQRPAHVLFDFCTEWRREQDEVARELRWRHRLGRDRRPDTLPR